MTDPTITTVIPFGVFTAGSVGIRQNFTVETTTSGTAATLTLQSAKNTATAATRTSPSANSFMTVTEVESAF